MCGFEMKMTKNSTGNSYIEVKTYMGRTYTFLFSSPYAFDFAREQLEEVSKGHDDFNKVVQNIKRIASNVIVK